NESMRAMFGGLPDEGDSVLFEYHRASAIHFEDTTQSMHFNSLHLPVWNTWGNTDLEWLAYGHPSEAWDSLRRASHADTMLTFPTDQSGHGLSLMPADAVCDWLSSFSANRFPDRISINADESGDYYWTTATLADTTRTFGRYGAHKDSARRRMDITMISNVVSLEVRLDFAWSEFDSLICRWEQQDERIAGITVRLDSIPVPHYIEVQSGILESWGYDNGRLTLTFHSRRAEFTLRLGPPDLADGSRSVLPREVRLVSVSPNPFNSSVQLRIESDHSVQTEVLVYDVLGRRVMSKAIHLDAGVRQISLNAEGWTSGQYFVTLAHANHPPLRVTLLR
ncbi:MAG: T9SS type A sorting domain-containing protein, partial [bacterium]|nr:T9SS type A sorting domain-containing protein [bacterium]